MGTPVTDVFLLGLKKQIETHEARETLLRGEKTLHPRFEKQIKFIQEDTLKSIQTIKAILTEIGARFNNNTDIPLNQAIKRGWFSEESNLNDALKDIKAKIQKLELFDFSAISNFLHKINEEDSESHQIETAFKTEAVVKLILDLANEIEANLPLNNREGKTIENIFTDIQTAKDTLGNLLTNASATAEKVKAFYQVSTANQGTGIIGDGLVKMPIFYLTEEQIALKHVIEFKQNRTHDNLAKVIQDNQKTPKRFNQILNVLILNNIPIVGEILDLLSSHYDNTGLLLNFFTSMLEEDTFLKTIGEAGILNYIKELLKTTILGPELKQMDFRRYDAYRVQMPHRRVCKIIQSSIEGKHFKALEKVLENLASNKGEMSAPSQGEASELNEEDVLAQTEGEVSTSNEEKTSGLTKENISGPITEEASASSKAKIKTRTKKVLFEGRTIAKYVLSRARMLAKKAAANNSNVGQSVAMQPTPPETDETDDSDLESEVWSDVEE